MGQPNKVFVFELLFAQSAVCREISPISWVEGLYLTPSPALTCLVTCLTSNRGLTSWWCVVNSVHNYWPKNSWSISYFVPPRGNIYHVGKILGMKFQNVFSDSTCVSTYQGCKRAPHGYIECKGFHTQTSMVLFEKGKNPPPRILDVKLYFC